MCHANLDLIKVVKDGDVEGIAGLLIEWLTLFKVFRDVGYQLVWTLAFQQRAFHFGHKQVLVERLWGGFQVNDVALLVVEDFIKVSLKNKKN